MFVRLLAFFALLAAVLPFPVLAEGEEPPHAVIVMYHRFGEDRLPSTNIRLSQFRAHLDILRDGGFTVLPLAEVVSALAENRPLPPRSVAITIDDAYASFYESGWPLLRDYGFPATLFVATEPVGGRGYMTWDQLREVAAAGVALGAHSHAHPSYPTLSPEQQAADLEAMTALFDAELGMRPTLFAYPYGEADATTLGLIEAQGYHAAFGQHSGVAVAGVGREEWFYLPRFALNENYGATERFRQILNTLPLAAVEVSPTDPAPLEAPAHYSFTVTDPRPDLSRLACFGPGGTALPMERNGPHVSVVLPETLAPGRLRLNCTLPEGVADDGTRRFRWRGLQLLIR